MLQNSPLARIFLAWNPARDTLLPGFLRPRKVHTKGATGSLFTGKQDLRIRPLHTSAKKSMMMARRMLLRGAAPLSSLQQVQSLRPLAHTAQYDDVSLLQNSSETVSKFLSSIQSRQPALRRGNPCHILRAISGLTTDAAAAAAAPVTPEDVLRYWFKDADLANNKLPMQFWFYGGEATDNEIKERFGECLERASRGEFDIWKSTPRGRVALVLVLDQFSRNCHRDSSRGFAQDEAALQITLDSIHQGVDQQVSNPLERYFLYMPLMHSESLEVHEEAHRVFQKLVEDHKDNPAHHEFFQSVVKFAKAHSAVLGKFGRYPSRNAVLARTSTLEEEAYLARGELWPMED